MAGIDKTCVKSFEEYNLVKDWCFGKVVCDKPHLRFDSYYPKLYASSFLYGCSEEDIEYIKQQDWYGKEKKIVLWDAPEYFDRWLAKNCPIDFIQERLHEQYINFNEWLNDEPVELDRSDWVTPRINYNENLFSIGTYFIIYVDYHSFHWTYNQLEHKWYYYTEPFSYLFPGGAYFKGVPTKRKINRILSKWKLPKGVTLSIYVRWKIGGQFFRQEENFIVK